MAALGEILKQLTHSKENGNVIGIWVNKVVCLYVVEDIIDVEIMNDKLVVLKKIDPQNFYLSLTHLYVSEIEKVISFQRTYSQHLMSCMQESSQDTLIKIKRHEQLISSDDLKMILVRNIHSGSRVSIVMQNNEVIGSCYVLDLNPIEETVSLARNISAEEVEEIPIGHIKQIEFEFHNDHKGFSSRVFKMNREDSFTVESNNGNSRRAVSNR